MDRLQVLFVERFDPKRGIEDTESIKRAAQGDDAILFFPEGTFVQAPGLLPFRLGAFQVAAETKSPILPVILHGTHDVLPADRWLPRRRGIAVDVLPAILPKASDWREAIRLRDLVQSVILQKRGG